MKSKRTHRAAELIQKIIAQLLQREVQDPRLSAVTVTGVDLSPDFKQATIFFTMLEPTDEAIKEAQAAFQKATGFFRLHVSRMTELRHTPQLTFKYDNSVAHGEYISNLLK